MGPTWGPPGSSQPQMGPMLAPWTLLLGLVLCVFLISTLECVVCCCCLWPGDYDMVRQYMGVFMSIIHTQLWLIMIITWYEQYWSITNNILLISKSKFELKSITTLHYHVILEASMNPVHKAAHIFYRIQSLCGTKIRHCIRVVLSSCTKSSATSLLDEEWLCLGYHFGSA